MSARPEPSGDAARDEVVHQFTVQRGMVVAIVIETQDWYLGLVQAALTRIRLEGQN
jgi:hypothetical protein